MDESHAHVGQDLFVNAFHYAPIGMALVALDGTWLKANPALHRILGYTEADLQKTTFQDLTYPDDLDQDLQLVQQVLRGEIDTYQMTKRYIHKEGHIIWALLSVSLVYDAHKQPLHFISQIIDITEQREAEAEIRDLSGMLIRAWENITDGFLTLDADWRLLYANHEAEVYLGRSKDSLLYKSIWEEYPALCGTAVERKVREAVETQTAISFEVFLSSFHKWFDIRVFPAGDILSIYFQDITERRRLHRKLRESEEWFRLLAEHSTDMISKHTAKGVYTYVSPICKKLLGYDAEDFIGKSVYEFFHPDDMVYLRKNHEHLLQQHGIHTVQYRMRKKDGSYTWFDTALRAIRDQTGTVLEVIAASHDISAKKEIEEKLKKAHQLSETDSLTGIANRRVFEEKLTEQWQHSEQTGHSLSVLFLDIDYFKFYNDTYGHLQGDECLRQVARGIEASLQQEAVLTARHGGEEFVALLTQLTKQDTLRLAEQVRSAVEALHIPHRTSLASPYVTVSVGAAMMTPHTAQTPQEFLELADKALYQAKRNGRNQVHML